MNSDIVQKLCRVTAVILGATWLGVMIVIFSIRSSPSEPIPFLVRPGYCLYQIGLGIFSQLGLFLVPWVVTRSGAWRFCISATMIPFVVFASYLLLGLFKDWTIHGIVWTQVPFLTVILVVFFIYALGFYQILKGDDLDQRV